ncbi:unnamed protein product [Effrenium voratum]|nr:unnamed protein product [Effrenium voratum]
MSSTDAGRPAPTSLPDWWQHRGFSWRIRRRLHAGGGGAGPGGRPGGRHWRRHRWVPRWGGRLGRGVVDSTGSQICDACKEAASVRPAGYQNWGGGRLGADSSEPQAAPAATATAEPTVTDRLSDTATSAGKHLGEAASAVGDGLSSVGSWVRKSVSSATGSEEPKKEKAEAFKPFAGAGQPLVPAPSAADRAAARAAAAEAAMRRSGQAPAGSSGARGSAPAEAGSSAARQAGTAA